MRQATGFAESLPTFPVEFADGKSKAVKPLLQTFGLTVTGVVVAILLLWLHSEYKAWSYRQCLSLDYSSEYCSAQQQPPPIQ